jgi:hypothetical protein
MFKRLFPASELRREFGLSDVRALRSAAAPMLDELLGAGEWMDDESDYGFSLSVGFKDKKGELRAIHLSFVDRDEPQRSYILSVEQARAIIEENL